MAGLADQTRNILKELLSEELYPLLDSFEVVDYPKGAVLWQIGDPGDFIGLIIQGEVALKKALPTYGKPIIIEMLWEQEFLGECALNAEAKRETIAEAMQPCRLAVLRRETLDRLKDSDLKSVNALLQKMLFSVSRRLTRMSNRLTRLF